MTTIGWGAPGRKIFRTATAMMLGLPVLAASGLGLGAAAGAPIPPPPASSPALQPFAAGSYIVMLKENPLASYDGGVPGIGPTRADKGRRLNPADPNAQRYIKYLQQRQQKVAAAGGAQVRKTFTTAVNAFVAELSAAQAGGLAKNPDVLSVTPNQQFAPDYSSTDFLKLRGPDGVWNSRFGGEANAGKGVVVGVIDTGYYPASPYLAGDPVAPLPAGAQPVVGVPYRTAGGTIAMLKADGSTFEGTCQTGEDFDGTACNSKVLGARYYADDFLASTPPPDRDPDERISPFDIVGHGTHTASTAAGNNGIEQSVGGRGFGLGSGVAPAAKVSVYKICWEDTDPVSGGCFASAAVDAIEQSILDGVDVLNYSISGNTEVTTDPVALAFLNAAAAGIAVAVSAGNSGPAPGTVNHPAPWLTTVGATTFSNELTGTVEVSDGTKYRGVSIMSHEVPQTAVVLAANAAAAGVSGANAALCLPESLDPAKATGKIVICDRGSNPRAEKSVVVAAAGGVGMVLVNVVPGTEDSDKHAVPTVHISDPSIKDKFSQNPALTAALVSRDTTGLPPVLVPQMAVFSSRGPSQAEHGDLLKPDITAPGVNVLAGVSPLAYGGDTSGYMSGTSMASPHVAGMAALLLGKQPTWSAAAVKSALMTSAADVLTAEGAKDKDVFATGAGLADPDAMAEPGLIYEAGLEHWQGYLQGRGLDYGLTRRQIVPVTDVNVPSIAVGRLTGEFTVTRTVTAVTPGRYQAAIEVPGINATVSAAVLTFGQAGQSRSFTVTFSNRGAALNEFATGALTWTGPDVTVTSPVAVRPVTATAPESVSFASRTGFGAGTIPVTSGTNTPLALSVKGLAKANRTAVEKVPGGSPSATEDAHNSVTTHAVPAGTTTASFAVNAEDLGDDWDLYVITPAGTAVQSATGNASERLVITDPEPGNYTVIAHLFETTDGAAGAAAVEVTALGGDEGNLSVRPNPLPLRNGMDGNIVASWRNLTPGSYVGTIQVGAEGPVVVVNLTVG